MTDKGPAVFRLKEHIQRLLKGAKTCFMKVPFSEEELIEATLKTVKENGIDAGYIRPIIYYGYGKMGLDPHGAPVNVSIACWPWGSYLGDSAVKVKTSSFVRLHPRSTHAEAKIDGHYVNSIFASIEAKQAGFNEAILLDYEGNIAEGPGENLFIVKDGKIFTPALGNVLPGITRDSVTQIARDQGLEVKEKVLTKQDMTSADEAFFTGTAAEVTVIGQIDEHVWKNAPGPITEKLKGLYLDAVHGKLPKYHKWLSVV